jgi:hypothetical protein
MVRGRRAVKTAARGLWLIGVELMALEPDTKTNYLLKSVTSTLASSPV